MGRSLRDLEPALNAADEIWLRAFKSRLHDALPPAVAHDLPDWLWDRLGAAYGDANASALARAWLTPAPFDLRVNPLKATRDAALAALAADGFEAAATPYSPLGIRIAGRPSLAQHPWLADGRLEVQDEGSQLDRLRRRAEALRHGRRFLRGRRRQDAAAGRADALAGTALRIRRRAKAPREPHAAPQALGTVERASAGARERARHQGQAPRGKIDRVLVDAPCTGFGTLRRNPDLKWRQPESAVAELAAKQASILAAAAHAREARRPPRVRDVQRAAGGERGDRRRSSWPRIPAFAPGNAAADSARAGIALDTGPR